jgi:molybdate transport system regulatory protein
MEVKSKVWIEIDGRLCFGAGRAAILAAVKRVGSLSQAARELGMSYRHAWSVIRAAEQRLGRPLLIRKRGGRDRGGAVLTPFGEHLLARFEELNADVRSFADRRFRKVFLGKEPK